MIALVLGSAKGNWEEAEAAFREFPVGLLVVVNTVVADYRGVAHAAVTLHPKLMADWWETRKQRMYHPIARCVAHRRTQGGKTFDFVTDVVDFKWPEQEVSGSSGHYAIKVAMELFGAQKVILAGVPMQQDRCHYYTDEQWNASIFLPAWHQTYDRLKDRVRSMSGITQKMFGKPDKQWVNS